MGIRKIDSILTYKSKIKQEHTTKTLLTALFSKKYWGKYTWKHVKQLIPYFLCYASFLVFPFKELYIDKSHLCQFRATT